MTKQRVVLTLVLCSLTALLTAQALSQTRSSNRSARASAAARQRRMTDAERVIIVECKKEGLTVGTISKNKETLKLDAKLSESAINAFYYSEGCK